jgi:hypothetical protein
MGTVAEDATREGAYGELVKLGGVLKELLFVEGEEPAVSERGTVEVFEGVMSKVHNWAAKKGCPFAELLLGRCSGLMILVERKGTPMCRSDAAVVLEHLLVWFSVYGLFNEQVQFLRG